MNRRTYSLVTGICYAIIIASAFVYDSAGAQRWFVGAVAVGAGVVAAITYVYNRSRTNKVAPIDQAEGSADQAQQAEVTNLKTGLLHDGGSAPSYKYVSLDPDVVFFDCRVKYYSALRSIYDFDVNLIHCDDYPTLHRSHPRKQGPQSNDAVNYVEVIERLSASQGGQQYEYVITKTGDLRIKPLGKPTTTTEMSEVLRGDLPTLWPRDTTKPN